MATEGEGGAERRGEGDDAVMGCRSGGELCDESRAYPDETGEYDTERKERIGERRYTSMRYMSTPVHEEAGEGRRLSKDCQPKLIAAGVESSRNSES
jgi:hypothetical protein